MNHFNETALALSRVTDTGLFEHLVTAVLREASPDLYGNLTQPGTNAQGKPVKSPVDAISFVPKADPRHMVVVHHTTYRQVDLKKKWALDPTTVKTRKGGKSIAEPGDLLKTVSIAEDERKKSPNLLVTLALTTNEEPPEDVIREVERVAGSHQIMLDIWSRSRIADFLDNNANGQWLRKKYLGITQERLSFDLLRELGQKSLAVYQSPAREQEQIARVSADTVIEELPVPVGFLAGESGFGKSVACYQHLGRHLTLGGCCLVLPHEVLATSITLDQAIGAALRQLHPSLAEGSGAQARALCSADVPLLITVEDISRSGQSALLIDRLIKWAESLKNDKQRPNWRLICPIWPELLGSLDADTRKRVEPLTRRLSAFTPEEARTAILKRACLANLELSELEADSIAEILGCDPLLIGLHDLNSTTAPTDVIATFVSQSAARVSQAGSYMANEYRTSLRALAKMMLTQKQMAPKWDDVLSWFSSSAGLLTSLREQAKHSEVIRITEGNQESQVLFRHDRVRKWLLTDAAIYAIKNNDFEDGVFSDPYFADVVGAALADTDIPVSAAEQARELNPLALFYALQSFREPSSPTHDEVIKTIDHWLDTKESHSPACQSLRYAVLSVLSETQSSYVLKILPKLKDRSWTGYIAGLRNGDLISGVKLCVSIEPGVGALWRDRAVEHAKLNFGPRLAKELESLLKNSHINNASIVGGLRLAGHLADTNLALAIEACWNSDTQRAEHLDDYLWAAAQCGGDQTERLLSPICDAWAALPDKDEGDGTPSLRNSLAAHHVAWAFWQSLPEPALRFFIKRASGEDLRWPIIYILHGIDHPEAVAFLAGYMAERSRELEETDGFDIFQNTVKDHWSRWQRERNKSMSTRSRAHLQEIWTGKIYEKHLRKHAFGLWAATIAPGDIQLLRSQESSGELADSILRARLERSDQEALPAFIEKLLSDNNGSWWQSARDIWSDSLTTTLHEYIGQLKKSTSLSWGESHNSDWIISELLMEKDFLQLESILLKHWEFMRFSPNYLQAALYAATPRLLTMVNQTIQECPIPEEMFKHIDMHFGLRTTGRSGVTRIEQIQALIPYLDYLSDSSIHQFWEVCNERGWIQLRREHLDSRLGEWKERVGLDDLHLLSELDKELTYGRPYWLDHWIDRHLGNGRSKEDIFAILKQWLRSKKCLKALQMAASIVIHAGTRKDIEILQEGGDPAGEATALIANTRFEIMRRTLA